MKGIFKDRFCRCGYVKQKLWATMDWHDVKKILEPMVWLALYSTLPHKASNLLHLSTTYPEN